MDAFSQLVSDFWYAVTHSIGHAIVSNKYVVWTLALLFAVWIAGIIYNETNGTFTQNPQDSLK